MRPIIYFILCTNVFIAQKSDLKVFLDCEWCDDDYTRNRIHYVDLVRDRFQADVVVLTTRQRTGSGGSNYIMQFTGKNRFDGHDFTLTYFSSVTENNAGRRSGLADMIERGLASYLIKTNFASQINIGVDAKNQSTSSSNLKTDPWDYWTFQISLDGNIEGESTYTGRDINLEFESRRVTRKFRVAVEIDLNESIDEYDNDCSTTTYLSRDHAIRAHGIMALGDHWSSGIWLELETETEENKQSGFRIEPAIEYNLFSYDESTNRQVRFQYRIGTDSRTYEDLTIYGKSSETLTFQRFSVASRFRRNWGNLNVYASYRNYFVNASFRRIEVNANMNLSIAEGFRIRFGMGYEAINDQLGLSAEGVSEAERLLNLKDVATDFQYHSYLGISYTFGSIYTNAVNPRFGF